MIRPLLLGVVLLAGCAQESAECSDTTPCTGFGQSCVEGVCKSRACSSSADCGMEAHCLDGECEAGCAVESDCYPGDTCTDGACTAKACRTTTLDCDFKEFCDVASGDCYEASGYYCGDCRDDNDCGGNGNRCLSFGQYGSFCGVTCERSADCPAGFDCIPVQDGGQVVTNQCITYCWVYITDDASGPPAPGATRAPVPAPVLVDSSSESCAVLP